MYTVSDMPAARPRAAALPVSAASVSAASGSALPVVGVRHVEWIAVLLLFIAAFVDMPARLGNVGGASVMGALSVVQLFLGIGGLVAIGAWPLPLLRQVLPYALFLCWMVASMAWAPPQMQGFQNAVVYGLFGVMVMLGGTLAAHEPERIDGVIGRGMRLIDVITLTAVAISLALIGLPIAGETSWYIGSRSTALVALMPLSWHLAHRAITPGARAKAAVWLAAIVVSLSRAATGVGIVYVLLVTLSRRPRHMGLFSGRFSRIVAIVCVVAALVTFVRPIRDRVFTGDLGWQVGSVGINVSGRANMWATVIESAQRSPLIGQGLGTSQLAIADAFELGHPHNDYLRVWHDLGVVGLLLFVASLLGWLGRLFSDWRVAARHQHPLAPLKLSATLALLGLLLAAITDNAIIYPFVMSPLGLLIGAGLGAPVVKRSVS
jgi:O-antigen ligase